MHGNAGAQQRDIASIGYTTGDGVRCRHGVAGLDSGVLGKGDHQSGKSLAMAIVAGVVASETMAG